MMICKCGHEEKEHAFEADNSVEGCYHSDNAVFCSCNLTPYEVLQAGYTALAQAARDALDSLSALIVYIKLHPTDTTITERDVLGLAVTHKSKLAALLPSETQEQKER